MRRKFFSLLIILALSLLFSISAAAQQRFVANLSGIQEVPANNSPGKGICRIILNAAETQLSVFCDYFGLPRLANAGHIHGNAAPGATAGVLFNFGTVTGTSGAISQNFNVTPAQVVGLRSKKWYIDIHSADFPGGELRGQIKAFTLDNDVDGDSRTDLIVRRPSNGATYALRSTDNTIAVLNGGFVTHSSILADFDSDGITDYGAVGVNPANGSSTILIFGSLAGSNGTFNFIRWGNYALGDTPASGDFDGDGRMDIALYRVSNGIWSILQSSDDQPRYEYWGQSNTDLPCAGDYDKDGKTDLCVSRPENNQLVWYIRRSSDNQFRTIIWGLSSDTVFPNTMFDVDGDGANDILVSRAVNGQRFFYALRSSNNSLFELQWGLESDAVKFGDFDADGKTDFAALRPINNQMVWFIRQSSDNQMRVVNWGLPGDQ